MAMTFKSWYSDLRRILWQPRQFFTQMKTKGGFNEPLQFALITAGFVGILIGVSSLSLPGLVVSVAFSVSFWTIFLFIQAFFFHAYAHIMGGHAPYETTFRIFSYLTPLSLFLLLLGGVAGRNTVLLIATFAFFAYVKFVEMNSIAFHHKISMARSAVAVVAFPILLMMLFLLMVAYFAGFSMQELLQTYANATF